MEIYILTAGTYSDYHIVGVFLDKEKAEKYCELANKKDNYFDGRIETYNTDDTDFMMHYANMTQYCFYFSNTGELIPDRTRKNLIEDPIDIETNVCHLKFSNMEYVIHVIANNDDKARKIAQDALAEFRAKEECIY